MIHIRVGIVAAGQNPAFFDTAPVGRPNGWREVHERHYPSGAQAHHVDVGRLGQRWRMRLYMVPVDPRYPYWDPDENGRWLERFDGITTMRLCITRYVDRSGEGKAHLAMRSRPDAGVELGGISSCSWSMVNDPLGGGGQVEQLEIRADLSRDLTRTERRGEAREEEP